MPAYSPVMLGPVPIVRPPSLQVNEIGLPSGSEPVPTRVTAAPAGDVASTVPGAETAAIGGLLDGVPIAKGDSEASGTLQIR